MLWSNRVCYMCRPLANHWLSYALGAPFVSAAQQQQQLLVRLRPNFATLLPWLLLSTAI